MNNDDRINAWRERRAATSAPGAGITIPIAEAAMNVVGDVPVAITFIQALVRDALASAARDTVAERRAVYEQIQDGIQQGIDRRNPPQELAEVYRRQLRIVVRLLEADIRQGVDVLATGYMPQTLVFESARLLTGYERRVAQRKSNDARAARRLASERDEPLEMALSPMQREELDAFRARMLRLHARQTTQGESVSSLRLGAVLPLLGFAFHLIHSESRVALLWALFGPAVLLSLISSMYFLMGLHYVLGMDVPTFSLIGATTWIMFRQIIFRSSTCYVSSRSLINIGCVTPLTLTLVQGLVYLIIYLAVYAALLTLGYSIGLITLPYSWAGFALFVVLMAVGGASIGLIFGSIATSWPYFLRFAAVIERFLEVFSGVFFVSEQFPVQYRGYFLWSPFAHGMQLLRSSYFFSYTSRDASLGYFLSALVFLFVIALIAERSARTRVTPM
jgi:ABC-type polysaccharide/polyol phosphate export permease